MGVEDAENGERRIEDNSDPNEVKEGLRGGEPGKETECSAKPKKNRQDSPQIFPDHPDSMALAAEIPDAQIIESPEHRKK